MLLFYLGDFQTIWEWWRNMERTLVLDVITEHCTNSDSSTKWYVKINLNVIGNKEWRPTLVLTHCICRLPWWLRWLSICLQCGRPGFDPWVGKIPWRRKWQPTPVFLPGESQKRRSLAGYSPWGCKESDMTERLHFHFQWFRILCLTALSTAV